MKYDAKHFKRVIKGKKATQAELADMLHISEKTFSHKVNGKYQWLLREMIEICEYLGIESLDSLFITK